MRQGREGYGYKLVMLYVIKREWLSYEKVSDRFSHIGCVMTRYSNMVVRTGL